eukprot:s4752_g6.t1
MLPPVVLHSGADGLPLLAPFSVGYVKGWRRSTALLAIFAALYDMKTDLEELSSDFKAGLGLLEWGNLSAVTKAFGIGRSEAQAVIVLSADIQRPVLKELCKAVSVRGMRSFLTHEVLLFLKRICADWDSTNSKMRKALVPKDAQQLHLSCGMFLHFLGALQARAPSSEFEACKSKLMDAFMSRLIDPELIHAAETSVPPGDLTCVGVFRQGGEKIGAYENRIAIEAEEKQQQLAAKVLQATFEQLEDQVNTDWALLRKGDDFVRRWMEANCVLRVVPEDSKAQTNLHAVTKRVRLIEDALFNSSVDFSNRITLVFQKESARATTDKRPSSQVAYIRVSSKPNRWTESSAVTSAVIGPCAVCAVSDMIGYDADVRRQLALNSP